MIYSNIHISCLKKNKIKFKSSPFIDFINGIFEVLNYQSINIDNCIPQSIDVYIFIHLNLFETIFIF